MQKQVLEEILDRVSMHLAVHGFRKGCSVRTFAEPHTGSRAVLRMDLREFFPSISRSRVQAVFRTMGYPERVADLLGGICTHATPQFVWRNLGIDVEQATLRDARIRYARTHLPQGAPTSPALANLCGYRLDCRLEGLARAAGARYTRYGDDLAFSGDEEFARRADRFTIQVAVVVNEEGLEVHHRKTRLMRRGVRQHLAGVVVNEHVNVGRQEYDTLKAILTNCRRNGPESQNRTEHAAFREHLLGRVAHVAMLNPGRAEKLRRIFGEIVWR